MDKYKGYRTPIGHWNFWPGIFSDYSDLNQAVDAMNKAVGLDKDEYSMCERDRVLGGVVRYLAENIPDEQKYQVLRILEVYCGKPVEQARLQYEQDEPIEQKG